LGQIGSWIRFEPQQSSTFSKIHCAPKNFYCAPPLWRGTRVVWGGGTTKIFFPALCARILCPPLSNSFRRLCNQGCARSCRRTDLSIACRSIPTRASCPSVVEGRWCDTVGTSGPNPGNGPCANHLATSRTARRQHGGFTPSLSDRTPDCTSLVEERCICSAARCSVEDFRSR